MKVNNSLIGEVGEKPMTKGEDSTSRNFIPSSEALNN